MKQLNDLRNAMTYCFSLNIFYSASSLSIQFIFGAEKDNEDRVIDADRLKLLFEVNIYLFYSLAHIIMYPFLKCDPFYSESYDYILISVGYN
jgi:hypothetical protein